MSLEGQSLGEFEILSRIGQGGMGAVYKARQTSLDRLVALKTLQSQLAGDAEFIARFRREAKAAASLNHPNLVQVYSAGETNGLHWFAMEFVEGESAQVRTKRKEHLDPEEAIAIGIHVATALEYGWRKAQLIHRDIKPDNIFLSSDGEVKLGDLGLAKSVGGGTGETHALTMTGSSMGTPHYVSPEQGEGSKDVDLRSDIYSLGCTLFHLATGKPPYGGDTPFAVMMKHVSAPIPNPQHVLPGFPAELARVVMKMMAKSPEGRQQSYTEVIADLRRAHEALRNPGPPHVAGNPAPVAARPPQPQPAVPSPKAAVPQAAPAAKAPQPAGSPGKPRKFLIPAIAAAVLLVAFTAWFFLRDKKPQLTEAERAEQNKAATSGTQPTPQPTPAVSSSPATVAKQTIDLLALTDPVKDRVTDPRYVGANQWSRGANGSLIYTTDGKAGKLIPPVSIEARSYEFELAYRRTSGSGDLHIDVPLDGVPTSLALILDLPGSKFINGKAGFTWPSGLGDRGTVVLRCETAPDGQGKVSASFDGRVLGEWSGAMRPAAIATPSHPDFPGQRITSLFCRKDSYEITSWKLRVFEGEAKVLRQPGAGTVAAIPPAASPPSSASPEEKRTPLQVINLLALASPTEDLVGYTGATGVNRWLKTEGKLVYDSDGKMGKLIPPVNIMARDFEIEYTFRQTTEKGNPRFHIDIPIYGQPKVMPLRLNEPGQKFISNKPGDSWPGAARTSGTFVIRCQMGRTPGEPDRLQVSLDGKTLTDWRGSLADSGVNIGKHLSLPVERQTALVCLKDGYEFTKWELRVFEGEAKVLRGAGAASTPPDSLNDPAYWQNAVNLLPLIDPKQDGVAGIWRLEGGRLISNKERNARIQIPYLPPEEFDCRIVFRFDEGSVANGGGQIAQFISKSGKQFSWIMGAKGGAFSAFETIAGMTASDASNPTSRQANPVIAKGVSHTSVVQVRNDGTKAFLNGKLLADLKTDYGNVGMVLPWKLQDSRLLGVGSFDTPVTFERIELLEVKGRGTRLREPAPNPPAANPASTANPSSATKDAPFVNTLGMKFVPVTGTKALFSVWDTRVQDYEAYAKAQLAKKNNVNNEWKTQEKDGVPVGREPDHPVVGVNWDDAQAFCQWLTEKETAEGKLPPGQRYRLPTDEEWSAAVGLSSEQGATPDERSRKNDLDFPWGGEWPPSRKVGNYADEAFEAKFLPNRSKSEHPMGGYDDGFATTSPVGSFPANALGLYDMGGNVEQWCDSWWNAEQKDRVVRGASWMQGSRYYLRSSARFHLQPVFRRPNIGFRCVLAPVGGTAQAAATPAPSSPSAGLPAWIQPELPAPGPDGWIAIFDGKVLCGANISPESVMNKSIWLENDALVLDSTKFNVPIPHADVAVRFTARTDHGVANINVCRSGENRSRYYAAAFGLDGQKVSISVYNPEKLELEKATTNFNFKEFFTGEFKSIGNRLSLTVKDRTITSTIGNKITGGELIAIGGAGGRAFYRRIEVKLLSPVAPAK